MKKTLTLITLAVMVALATLAATMSMASVTWTVAGVVDLCGTEWDPTDANNDMTMQSDGVTYVLIKENCELEAGIPYEYKVVANHSWSESYGNANGGNASFMVEESGKYTITFSFNSSTHTVSASAANTASYTPDKKTWTIAGSEALMGSEWDASDVQNDMHETSDGVYTLLKENVALDAGVYEYKVCANHRWTVSYGGENGVNMSLTIGHSGLYNVSFTFDVVSKSLTASASLAEGTISVSSALEIIDGYEDGGRSDDLYFVQGVISGDVLVYNEQACFMLSDMEDSSKKISVQVKGFNNEAYEEGAVKEGDQIVVCACLYKYLSDGSVTPYLFPGYIFELQKSRTAITTSTSTMISFNDEATAGNVQSSYAKDDFVLNCYDNSSKFAIDANSAYFGDVEDCHFFSYRLKTGGASTASRYLSLSIPHAGKLRIYARTASNAATNRNIVLTQNEKILTDKVLLESDAIAYPSVDATTGESITRNIYPAVESFVDAGTVDITFPVGGVNFYGFELITTSDGSSEGGDTDKVYTIAGDAEFVGSAWDPTDANNDMTKVFDDLYVLTKKNVALTTGKDYGYKVTAYHSWTENYGADGVQGGENVLFSVSEDGNYDVTILFVESTKELTALVEKAGTSTADRSQAYYELFVAISKAKNLNKTLQLTEYGVFMLNAAVKSAQEALDTNDDETMTAAAAALKEVVEKVTSLELLDTETIWLNSSSSQSLNGSTYIKGKKAQLLFASSGGNTPYRNKSGVSFYTGNTLTIEATTDTPISKVSIFATANDTGESYEAASWSEDACQDITFRNNNGVITLESVTQENLRRAIGNYYDYINLINVVLVYDNPSEEALMDRLAIQLSMTDEALQNMKYLNVPGRTELVSMADEARTLTAETEKTVVKAMLRNLKAKTSEVLALDQEYQSLETVLDGVVATAEGNQYADAVVLEEATTKVNEVRKGLEDGVYTFEDIQNLKSLMNNYSTLLTRVYLTIHVETAGSMGDLILDKVENFADVYGLRLSGTLDDVDLTTLKSRMTGMRFLDMAGVNMTTIAKQQFSGNKTLISIVLPNNLEVIGEKAFYGCTYLHEVGIPSTLKTISANAFYDCKYLTSIEIPEGVTSIGDYAFYCESQQYYNSTTGSYNYRGGNLKSLKLPSTLNSLGKYAFGYQTELESLDIADGLTSIGSSAFYYCTSLKNLSLPATLRTINSCAFQYCSSLQQLNIPEGVTSIGQNAFSYCTGLTEVNLPTTIQNLYNAFSSCGNITKMRCMNIIPPYVYNTNVLGGNESKCTLTVPNLASRVYKQTSYWDQFNIVGEDFYPEQIDVSVDYRLNWPDNIPAEYKPVVRIFSDASLTVTGNTTLSASYFRMIYSANNARANTYTDLWNNTVYQRDNCYAALMSNGRIRSDQVNVMFYSQANQWDFLSLPFDVKVGDIRPVFEGTPFVVRRYDGQKRAEGLTGETWVNMTADSTLHAGQGYIWQSASTDANRNYNGFIIDALQTVNKNNIFANEDVEVALSYYASEFEHNRSWNLIGNPYPAYYDIRAMQTSSPVTVWDTYNKNYQAYSPEDDAYILNPGQAFFVQCPVNEDKITFLTEGRQTGMEVRSVSYGNRAARTGQRSVFNILLTGNDMNDRTRFVINAEASMDYETGRDAGKLMSMEQRTIQLYTQQHDVRYAINERPLNDGIIELGLQVCASGKYTLTLDTAVDNEVYLIDRETGVEIRLDGTDGYSFYVDKGTVEGRFAIRLGDGYVTGISNVSSFNDGVNPNEDNYYNLNGVRVQQPQKGLYIQNGRKVVVK